MSDARNKILGDVSQLISGLGVAAQGVREELAQTLRGMLDTMLADGALVTREEFEVVREMAEKARAENQRLQEEIDALKPRYLWVWP
ncbi:MAG: accessory factor UbiK family protein [Pseudomonadota bacterium]|nr:accessory factor UbiK family protein [Pseudomonadota bacterium]